MKSMIFARFISFVSNPIFILICLPYFLTYRATRDTTIAWYWTFYTWAFLFVFGGFVLLGVKKKFFSDVDVSERRQRPLLYFFGAVLGLLYLYGLILLNAPKILFVTIYGILFGIVIGSIVNMRVKASVHVAAASALLTALCVVYNGYYFLFLLFIPLICWSRVKIRKHTLAEVIAGGILGSLLSLIMYMATRTFLQL